MADNLYVVIATAGRPTLLERTLDSLVACTKPDIYCETIVVENGPRMGAEAIVQKFVHSLNTRYLHVAQPNKSNALNSVLALLESGLIFFADDDIRLEPQILCHYALAAEGCTSGKYFGGTSKVDYEEEPPQWLLPSLPGSARAQETTEKQRYFLGFNWAAYVSDLKAVGGFDPLIGPGSPIGATLHDESDAQDRLRAQGAIPVYVAEAVVWHFVPKTRSSVQWVLHRQYKTGYSSGLLKQRRNNSVSTLIVNTLKSTSKILLHLLWTVGYLLTFDKARALKAFSQVYQRFGMCQGHIVGYSRHDDT